MIKLIKLFENIKSECHKKKKKKLLRKFPPPCPPPPRCVRPCLPLIMTFNVQKGHFDTRNVRNLPTVGGWHLSHTLPSLSRFVVPPPPPLENFGYASVCIERRYVIFYFRNSLTLPSIFFFFFFGGGGYFTSSINVFYEQWIYCFLHTLSSGFKRGQFVCVLRAVQCVLSALSAKVEVADINVNDRCAAFLYHTLKQFHLQSVEKFCFWKSDLLNLGIYYFLVQNGFNS